MNDIIKPMTGYKITPANPGQNRLLAFCSGRQGNVITLMLVNGILTGEVTVEYGREFCQVDTPVGKYNLSPCGEVHDLNEVAEVCDLIRNCPS